MGAKFKLFKETKSMITTGYITINNEINVIVKLHFISKKHQLFILKNNIQIISI